MLQRHISDENTSERKFSFRSSRIKILVITVISIIGIGAILAFPRATHLGAGSSGSSASSAAHSNGMFQTADSSSATNGAIAKAALTAPAQRLIIESASLTITVADVTTTADKISQLIARNNGFVQSMNQYTNQGQSTTNMTIRVPETTIGEFINTLKSYGPMSDFSQTGQDVTEQHNNLQEQIGQLQSESNAYSRLFNKAQTMQDMLEIQQSLSQVNAEISSIQNQLHDLNRSVQLATITVNLTTQSSADVAKYTTFTTAFKQSIQFMGHVVIITLSVIGWLLPWGIVVAVICFGWRRWSNWRKLKSKSKHE